jgi:hypothetical protein
MQIRLIILAYTGKNPFNFLNRGACTVHVAKGKTALHSCPQELLVNVAPKKPNWDLKRDLQGRTWLARPALSQFGKGLLAAAAHKFPPAVIFFCKPVATLKLSATCRQIR